MRQAGQGYENMPSESQPYHTKRIHLRYAQKDGIIETSQINSFYRRICEAAGIEYNGQQALGHTFATRSIEAGVPPLVLKKWLGHTNLGRRKA